MISYPLREYLPSKKNDDYRRSSSADSSSEKPLFHRWVALAAFVAFLIVVYLFSIYYSLIDPTCFNRECRDSVCKAYEQGLIGGRLCPDLCTTDSLRLENCLGKHQNTRSRLFDDEEGNQVIRCYLKYSLTEPTPSNALQDLFRYPEENSTLGSFYRSLEEHIRKTIPLDDTDEFIEQLIKFADFNEDRKMSLSESRSLWSLVQIDEFLYSMLFRDKGYSPKVLGSCGHMFSLERVANPKLPFNDQRELSPLSDRPNWYQRVRIAIGIIEFVIDTSHFQDRDEQLHLCSPLFRSFGYQGDFESRLVKMGHVVSSKSGLSLVGRTCRNKKDCLNPSSCHLTCNQSTATCQVESVRTDSLDQLCSLLSSLIYPDANATFVDQFRPLIEQCHQIVTDGRVMDRDHRHLVSLNVRQTLILEDLKNLLWSNIEYQMSKITKKSTKKPAPPPASGKK